MQGVVYVWRKKWKRINLQGATVTKSPEISTITPKSGVHKGMQTEVVEFDVAKNHYERQANGEFKQTDTNFYRVSVYGDDAKQIANLVQVGMPLMISGSSSANTWKDDKGVERTTNVINADTVGLDLSHARVKSIEFAPKALEAKAEATAKKTMDKPISERAKAEYKPAQKTAGLSK